MHAKLVLLTCSLVFGNVQSTVANCNGNFSYKPCCVGERWHSTEGKCVACPFNHYGENCAFTCNVPDEGYRCLKGECKCSRENCKVAITSSKCFTSKVPVYFSKSVDDTFVASSIGTVADVDNSTANSTSSSSGNRLGPLQSNNRLGTVYIIFIVLGVCLLFLIGLGVMDRVRVFRKSITKRRQEIPEPSYCEIKDIKLTIL